MPRSSKKPPRRGDGNMGMPGMGMFGMYGDEDDDSSNDHDLEAELSQILGEGEKKAKSAKPSGKQLMDWDQLNAQISASMQDVDEEDDSDPGEDDGLMAELEGLVGDENKSLQAPTQNKRGRSPSPLPQAAAEGSLLELLKDRKKSYEIAIQNAQSGGQSAKVRRLQRLSKTLDTQLKQVKSGKSINEDEIPPQVALGKPVQQSEAPANQTPLAPAPSISVSIPSPKTSSPEKTQPSKPAIPPRTNIKPTPPPPNSEANQSASQDSKTVQMLVHRQQEFKKAALDAKNQGNKVEALKYMKLSKQFDSVITAAKEGKSVDLSHMPSISQERKPPPIIPSKEAEKPAADEPAPPVQPQATGGASSPQSIPVPRTLLEGLIQRQQKYKSSADQAKAEGNSGKSRRMMRISKQYEDAIRSHKAGKPIDTEGLPVPMGYPPLPGVNEKQSDPAAMLEQAGNLLKIDDEQKPEPPIASASLAATAVRQPRLSPKPQARSPSPKPNNDGVRTPYQNQVEFLVNRQSMFKQAALAAKKKGDKEAAIDLIKKMKGFEPMIAQAKRGLKVDITKVPQPPMVKSADPESKDDDTFGILEPPHEDDEEAYKTIIDTLKEQIKKARGYSEQFTHSGDVNGANMFDRLSADSQRDYDFVKNLQRHSDPPPRYYFENKTFESVHIIPELSSGEIELIIIQLLDFEGAKDGKSFVEWEMPFPHDDPIKGRTEELKSSNPKYDAQFRIPIKRNSKAFQRAIKNKALKLVVMQKGGFLRSDKSFGTASVKLASLETMCEIRAVEQLRDGRAVTGKIEVKVRLRTPLMGSESRTLTEKWLVVSHEHVRRVVPKVAPRPSHGHKKPPSPSHKSPQKSTDSKIGSLEVLAFEKKMVDAKVQSYQTKGERPPQAVLQNQQSVQLKINATKRFLQSGGIEAKRKYVNFLKSEIKVMTADAQSFVKQGNKDKAKFALTKRKMVENELAKMAPSNTYL